MAASATRSTGSRFAGVVCMVSALAWAALAAFHNVWQPAFWQHLAGGRIVATGGIPTTDPIASTTAGTAWINPEWLGDLVLYALWQAGGAPLIVTLSALSLAATFALLWRPAVKLGSPAAAATAILLGVWLMLPLHDAWPWLLVLPLLATFVRVLEPLSTSWREWALLIPAQLLWINLHPTGVLGPILATCAALTSAVDAETPGEARRSGMRRAGLAAALLLLTMCNPYGFKLLAFIAAHPGMLSEQDSTVWISPMAGLYAASAHGNLLTGSLLLGACGFVLPQQRLPLWLTITATAGGLMLIRSVTCTILFVVLAFPFLAMSIHVLASSIVGTIAKALRYTRPVPDWVAVLAVLIVIATSGVAVESGAWQRRVGSLAVPGCSAPASDLPSAAIPVLRRPDFPARMVHLPTDGGYLAWARPGRPIFMDTRTGLYANDLDPLLRRALSADRAAMAEIERRWAPDALVINCIAPGASGGIAALRAFPSWGMVYFDGVTAVLVKMRPDTIEWFGNSEIQAVGTRSLAALTEGYAAAIQRGNPPPPPPALVGAAFVFDAIDRPQAAADIFALLVRGAPAMHAARLHFGACLVRAGRPAMAIEPLQEFTRAQPGHPLGWHWLAEALRGAGREPEAVAAAARSAALKRGAKP